MNLAGMSQNSQIQNCSLIAESYVSWLEDWTDILIAPQQNMVRMVFTIDNSKNFQRAR